MKNLLLAFTLLAFIGTAYASPAENISTKPGVTCDNCKGGHKCDENCKKNCTKAKKCTKKKKACCKRGSSTASAKGGKPCSSAKKSCCKKGGSNAKAAVKADDTKQEK
jgi:hypothetical protein